MSFDSRATARGSVPSGHEHLLSLYRMGVLCVRIVNAAIAAHADSSASAAGRCGSTLVLRYSLQLAVAQV